MNENHSAHIHHMHHAVVPEPVQSGIVGGNLTAVMDHAHSGHMSHSGTSMHMDGMDDMGGMSMSFHFGVNETILFSWWTVSTVGGIIGSAVIVFILAVIYEGLKAFREKLHKKAIARCVRFKVDNGTRGNSVGYVESVVFAPGLPMISLDHFIQTLLHMLQFLISYLLMLIFMTYNVWLCIACILGAGFGYFLFGWMKTIMLDQNEHCH